MDAAAAQGYIDPDRVGLYGLSMGGVGVLRIVADTGRFKAAASLNGIADFASGYSAVATLPAVTGRTTEHGSAGFYESPFFPLYMGGKTPWRDPQGYVEASPYFAVDRIATPLLLIHSELDQADVGQYRQMFEALSRLRKEAVYIEYRGEGHGLSSPANIRHKLRTLADWYDKHLKPAAD